MCSNSKVLSEVIPNIENMFGQPKKKKKTLQFFGLDNQKTITKYLNIIFRE
jgi:hypothetical protein